MPEEHMTEDTIPVRSDEGFDEEALAQNLHGKLPGTNETLKVRQFGGGAANLTYLLDYGEHEYVLRRPPLGPIAKSAHDMGREFKVLSVLHQVYPYAPQAYLYCDNAEIIGAPFFIMERRKGVVIRRTYPSNYAAIPDAPQQISKALVDALARFHGIDYIKLGLKNLGKPAGFVQRQIEGWYHRWHKAKTINLPEMETVYTWLKANQPKTTEFSLVHNDFKLDNCALDYKDPSKLVAVFDWDMCTLGDPLSDLGALLTYWTEPTDPEYFKQITPMPSGIQNFLSRTELVQRYAKQSGRSIDNINYYHVLGLFRLVVIIAQIYIRFKRGQTKDKRFAALASMIPLIAKAAQKIALG